MRNSQNDPVSPLTNVQYWFLN